MAPDEGDAGAEGIGELRKRDLHWTDRSTKLRVRIFVAHVIWNAEAQAGGGVHLPGRFDRVLEFGYAVTDFARSCSISFCSSLISCFVT